MIRRKEKLGLYKIEFLSIYKEKDSIEHFKEVKDKHPKLVASLDNDSSKQLVIYEIDAKTKDASSVPGKTAYIIHSQKHDFTFPCIYFSNTEQEIFDYVYYLTSIYYTSKGSSNINEVYCDRCGKSSTFNVTDVTASKFLKINISGMYEKDSVSLDVCYECGNAIFCDGNKDFSVENIFINAKRN